MTKDLKASCEAELARENLPKLLRNLKLALDHTCGNWEKRVTDQHLSYFGPVLWQNGFMGGCLKPLALFIAVNYICVYLIGISF